MSTAANKPQSLSSRSGRQMRGRAGGRGDSHHGGAAHQGGLSQGLAVGKAAGEASLLSPVASPAR